MMERMLIRLIVLIVYLVSVVAGCPMECQCHTTDKAVNCNGKKLTRIPINIPLDTQVLDLSSNNIDYIEPLTFQNLTNLTDIMLKYNKISKLDVSTFQNLPNLKIIGLGSNFLSAVPEGLFDNLPSLRSVVLMDNYLTSISNTFKSVSQLIRLDLYENSIQEIKNSDFRQLPNLVHLILSGNKISKIEVYALRPLEKLVYLSLKDNPLKNLARVLNKNRRLTYIDLSECQLKSVPRGLPDSIQHLQLNKNNITKIKPKDFKNKHYLAILVLDENQIEYIGPNAFNYQKNLKQLWLNANKLRKFPSPFSQTVTNIYLSKNNITKISASDFPRNSLITELVLNDNKIEFLTPKTFQNLRHLKNLFINSNKITKLSDNTFSEMKNLEHLSLKNNKLKIFEKNCFSGLSSLHDLNLGSSVVPKVSIRGNIFMSLNNLRILNLGFSEALAKTVLKSSEMLQSLRNLSDLNLMDNNLVTMSSNILLTFKNLHKIKLAGNRWHCDQRLRWMKSWLQQNEDKVHMKDEVTCYSPPFLRKKKIIDLSKTQFVNITTNNEKGSKSTTYQTIHVSTPSPKQTETIKHTVKIIEHTSPKYSATSRKSTPTQRQMVYRTTTENYEATKNNVSTMDDSFTMAITTLIIAKMSTFQPNKNSSLEIFNSELTNKPVLADGYKSINQTATNQSTVAVHQEEDDHLTQIDTETDDYNLVIIIIATTLSLLVMLVIIIIIIIICRRREKVVYHRALQYHKEIGDVVFFVGDLPQCVATITKPSRNNSRSRSERGSTSSRPSEDITNELDTTMKIYSLDE